MYQNINRHERDRDSKRENVQGDSPFLIPQEQWRGKGCAWYDDACDAT